MKLPVLAAIALMASGVIHGASPAEPPALPERLQGTALFVEGSTTLVRPEILPFSPQYPLWSDGAAKRRWLYLPPGTAIDAARPDAWEFPPGTRLWKEFSLGRRIETRYIERLATGAWRYATYIWNADGSDATLAPTKGIVVSAKTGASGASSDRYIVPSQADCRACHEGPAVPVLGASALQLSPDRDPLAPHAELTPGHNADLRALVAQGHLRNLPKVLLDQAPRIEAPTPTGRAALGYLHGNCGHCHNDVGPLAGLDLVLAQEVASGTSSVRKTLGSLLGTASSFRPHGAAADPQRVAATAGQTSVLTLRMRSANPMARMPPLGVQVIDAQALALIEKWIHNLTTEKGATP